MNNITLKEYFDLKVKSLEEKVELHFKLNKIALDKAEQTTNLRLEGMNEFRSAMKDQSNTYLTKSDYAANHKNLEDKNHALEKIVFMGLGALAVIELLFKFFIK